MSNRTTYTIVERGSLSALVSQVGVTVRIGNVSELRDYARRMNLTIAEDKKG